MVAAGLTVSLLPVLRLRKLLSVALVHFLQPGVQKLINVSALSSPASASKLKSEQAQTSDVSRLQSWNRWLIVYSRLEEY